MARYGRDFGGTRGGGGDYGFGGNEDYGGGFSDNNFRNFGSYGNFGNLGNVGGTGRQGYAGGAGGGGAPRSRGGYAGGFAGYDAGLRGRGGGYDRGGSPGYGPGRPGAPGMRGAEPGHPVFGPPAGGPQGRGGAMHGIAPGGGAGQGWGMGRGAPAGYDAENFRGMRTGEPRGGPSPSDQVRAGEIMTRYPEAVTPNTSVADVARLMKELDVGIVPVVDNEDDRVLAGVVTDRDIVLRVLAEDRGGDAAVWEAMTGSVETVHPGSTIRDVMTVMKRERVRRVPVVDDDGRLVGIISQADLAVGYAGLDPRREVEVEETIERISEPGR